MLIRLKTPKTGGSSLIKSLENSDINIFKLNNVNKIK